MNTKAIIQKADDIALRALYINALRRHSAEELFYMLAAIKIELEQNNECGMTAAKSLISSCMFLSSQRNEAADKEMEGLDKACGELSALTKPGA